MRLRFRFVVPLILLGALVAGSDPIHARMQDSVLNLAQALDRYEAGHVPAPAELSILSAMAADGRLLAGLERDGREWLRAAPPAQMDRRRLALAAFVLEAALAERHSGGTVSGALIEWACDRLRENPKPLLGERAWQIATVALMETGTPQYDPAFFAHLGHARARFKDEPRFLFADAWGQRSAIAAASQATAPLSASAFFPNPPSIVSTPPNLYRDFSGNDVLYHEDSRGSFRGSTVPDPQPLPRETASAHALWQSRQDYKHARKQPALAAEAALRLGDLDLSEGKPKNALDHFHDALERTADPDLVYLAQSLSGMAHEALKRWPDAEAAYRDALVAAPHGRSAANALAALLDRQGQPDKASAVRARVVDPAAVDPWTTFSRGDLVPYPVLLGELRKAAQAPESGAAFNLPRMLDRYEQGNLPVAAELAALAAMAADGRLLVSLDRDGREWLRAGGPAGIERRRLVLAAFVLEAVSAERDARGSVSGAAIEWACGVLQGNVKPLPAERAWLVATVGLMQVADPADVPVHFGHARARFKNEPRWLFVDAWLQRSGIPDGFRHNDMVSGNPYFPSGPLMAVGPIANAPTLLFFPQRTAGEWFAVGMDATQPGFTGGSVVDIPHSGTMPLKPEVGMVPHDLWLPALANVETRLWLAKRGYEHARGTSALAAEAELRLGDLELAYGKPKNAVDHFARALRRTSDRDLRYLAEYLTGLAQEKQLQYSEAEASYRRALEALSDGRYAIDRLARLLDGQGKATEATALRARAAGPPAVDPWETFSKGDLVPYAKLIQELRQAVR